MQEVCETRKKGDIMIGTVLTAAVVLIKGGVLAVPAAPAQPAAMGPQAKEVLANIAVPSGKSTSPCLTPTTLSTGRPARI